MRIHTRAAPGRARWLAGEGIGEGSLSFSGSAASCLGALDA
jgi:hypothetical protein